MTNRFLTMALRNRRLFRGLPLAGLLVATACREPTQLTVRITTDVSCSALAGTTITPGDVGDIEETPFSTSTEACTTSNPENDVGSIVLFPLGDKADSFAVKVVVGVDRPAEACLSAALSGMHRCPAVDALRPAHPSRLTDRHARELQGRRV